MNIKITVARQKRIIRLAEQIGKDPVRLTNKYLDNMIEELEDYVDVLAAKKQGGKPVTLKQLKKQLGLAG